MRVPTIVPEHVRWGRLIKFALGRARVAACQGNPPEAVAVSQEDLICVVARIGEPMLLGVPLKAK